MAEAMALWTSLVQVSLSLRNTEARTSEALHARAIVHWSLLLVFFVVSEIAQTSLPCRLECGCAGGVLLVSALATRNGESLDSCEATTTRPSQAELRMPLAGDQACHYYPACLFACFLSTFRPGPYVPRSCEQASTDSSKFTGNFPAAWPFAAVHG